MEKVFVKAKAGHEFSTNPYLPHPTSAVHVPGQYIPTAIGSAGWRRPLGLAPQGPAETRTARLSLRSKKKCLAALRWFFDVCCGRGHFGLPFVIHEDSESLLQA